MNIDNKILYRISFKDFNNEINSNESLICEITTEEEINLKNGMGLIDLLCQREITLFELIKLLKQNDNYTIINVSGNYKKIIEIIKIKRL
ncbi:MAG: hypothetical protein ACLRYM_14645 [Thomasclavelia ramosa]